MSSASTDHQRADDRLLVLAFVCATAFAVVLNGTMLPVALPEIGEALSLGPVILGWIITGYFLVNGVAIPFFGRLADLHGVGRLGVALPTVLGAAACVVPVVVLSGFGVGGAANHDGSLEKGCAASVRGNI